MSLAPKIAAMFIGVTVSAVAAEVNISKCPAQQSISVSVQEAVLIKLSNGEAATIKLNPVRIEESNYAWRYRATATSQVKTGAGRVFEDYASIPMPNGDAFVKRQNRERDLMVLAGNIAIRWSARTGQAAGFISALSWPQFS